jgi:hypothetical protein
MKSSGLVRSAGLLVALAGGVSVPVVAQEKWQGPGKGPPAQVGKSVVYIASVLKNGSVGTVYRGLQEAANTLGWRVWLVDGGGLRERQADALTAAVVANVATDPLDVARMAATFVIQDAMTKTIEACSGYTACRVLGQRRLHQGLVAHWLGHVAAVGHRGRATQDAGLPVGR